MGLSLFETLFVVVQEVPVGFQDGWMTKRVLVPALDCLRFFSCGVPRLWTRE